MTSTTTTRTVPVVCECGAEDMQVETTTEGEHRVVVWSCPACRWSEVTVQERHHLDANCGAEVVRIGSYWA